MIIADAMTIICQWNGSHCSLALATFVYSTSPGPGIFAVLTISTRYGGVSAFWLSIGHTIGDMTYVTVIMLALSALAYTIAEGMIYVKIIGSMYLMTIGYQHWRSKGVSLADVGEAQSIIKLLIAGFIVGGTNPETIIFYLSFLPIFIDLENLSTITEIQVVFVVGLVVLFVLSLANVLGLKLRQHIENPKVIKKVNEITGSTMILVGVFVGL